MTHTPGPWVVGAHPEEDVFQVLAPAQHKYETVIAAEVHEGANAYLIAAAPDLLAACKALVAFEAHNHPCLMARMNRECEECNTLALAASDLLRPAIKKARGEMPA